MVQVLRERSINNFESSLHTTRRPHQGHARARISSNTIDLTTVCENLENIGTEAPNLWMIDLNHPHVEQYQCPRLIELNTLSENESDDENVLSFTTMGLSYAFGDVKHIKEKCNTVHRVYPFANQVTHPSTLPLLFGDCLLHSLGEFTYACHFCNAISWRVEMVRERKEWIGKNCCSRGKVFLDPLQSPPPLLSRLLVGRDGESKAFQKSIRAYNSSLAFVSLGAHIDDQFTRGGGVYNFRIHGSTYHSIGPLMPANSEQTPMFAQLYVYDTEHELENRMKGMAGLNVHTLESLQMMMHEFNPYAHSFRSMREVLQTNPNVELRMVIKSASARLRQYSVPTGSEVAAIMPGEGECFNVGHRAIHVNFQGGELHRITNLNQSYMPLMYVLLFPRGEDGWHDEILMQDITNRVSYRRPANVRRTKVTQLKFYAFRLQCREDTSACLLRGGRLLQQFIVDAYSSIEESRLQWIRHNQPSLRAEVYQGLADMVNIGDGPSLLNGRTIGRRIVLPSSFTGGPRFMHQLYQDSMAIVRKKGKPDLFITFTCNPNWEDITNALLPGQTAQDRPDLTARVFYQKHKDMMHLLVKQALFGTVAGFVSVIEFQKRGLPHAHILLILEAEWKPTDTAHYDRLVCAEFPSKDMFPELYEIITHSNIHGPCGAFNMSSPCMVNERCKYHFPRSFADSTVIDSNGYPTYMRRDTQTTVTVKGNMLDCRWVVPYNPFLSLRYKAHINVEICSTITAVKYLYKYVYKGHDRATIQLVDCNGMVDEISKYLDARYVSASEACWRIFEFDLHEEKPDIQRLQVHLPHQNTVVFNDNDNVQEVVDNERNQKTSLTEWFVANQLHPDANNLLYMDFPCKWVWSKQERVWTRRKQGNTIGRMYNISPGVGELYFLRVLLTICKGCKSFEDVRTFDGILYPTFKSACLARGLLESDEEWCICLQEASLQIHGRQLRQLFVVILVFCEPIYPGQLWEKFSQELSEDFLYSLRQECDGAFDCLSLAKMQALIHVQELLQQYGKCLNDFEGMPLSSTLNMDIAINRLLMEESMFDESEQLNLALSMEGNFNDCQQRAYATILGAVYADEGDIFFLDGPGGSGKTYMYNALLARLRGEGKIALACASSGIAALLLANGRTAHSRFKIPLLLNADSTCNIKVNSALGEVMKKASLIIWDEAPMTHRHAFEALDRSLKDVMANSKAFGGKVMLFGGDFRQILPVVMKGSREDIVHATLCRSFLWRHVKVLRLTQNMRTFRGYSDASEDDFSKWILTVGDGTVSQSNKEDSVVIPSTMVLPDRSLQGLIRWVYGDLNCVQEYASFFKDRAVLAPRNEDVNEVNQLALSSMLGQSREYLSADTVASTSNSDSNLLYTIEYLNSLNLGGGFPPHRLVLKENAPIMLLRNLDPRRGLCNGTRLICKRFYSKVIEAQIITGTNIGDLVFIPRITFIPTTLQLPFDMRRRQFPVRLAFGMTINKSQGQTLGRMGLYLPSPVFTHGQMYVALSRGGSKDATKVWAKDGDASRELCTVNVVYKEVLQMASRVL